VSDEPLTSLGDESLTSENEGATLLTQFKYIYSFLFCATIY
jgi:hypothetical protein